MRRLQPTWPSTSSRPETVRRLGEVDSTNDEAAAWGRQGAPHGAAVVADAQRKGRGRLGRSWSSPAGGNLYVSFVLRPRRPADRLHGLTLAAAVAFTEALEELGAAVAIKWPNDLLLGGKKLGGILTELHVGRPKTFVVVGLGLNLASAPELPDGALVAASLAQLPGGPPDREALTAALRERLLAVVERFDEGGFAAVRPDWERRWRHKGRSVRADLPGGRSVEGIAIALDDDGALLLDTGGATPVRVTVGDVNACC